LLLVSERRPNHRCSDRKWIRFIWRWLGIFRIS